MKLNWIKSILVIWVLIILVYRLTICFSYLPELSNGESNNIWKAINVANGKPMYTNPEELPLEVFQYTPISQYPIIAIAKICDKESPVYLHQITLLGRIYELIANCLLITLVYLISKTCLFKLKIYAALTAIICFSLLTFPAFAIRPDATLLLLILTAVWCFLKLEESKKIIWLVLTSLLIISCFFTKQDGILIAFPFAVRLFMLKESRKLILLTGITTGFLTISIAIGPLIFGPYFFKCVFQGLKNTTSLIQLISVFDRAYGFYGFHFILGFIFSMYYIIKQPKKRIAFFSILNLFYLVIAIVTTAKAGSWVNYYTPYILFSTIVIFYFFTQLKHNDQTYNSTVIFSIAILLSLIFMLKQIYVYTSPFLKLNHGKSLYYSKYKEINTLKKNLYIHKRDKILTINQLDRNFLAENTIMINTEYYNYASYSYYNFKFKKNKKIDYIIYQDRDKPTIDYLLQFFNVNASKYSYSRIGTYNIFKK